MFLAYVRGNNLETFRFYEALESGAIPIFVKGSSVDYDYEGKSTCMNGSMMCASYAFFLLLSPLVYYLFTRCDY